MWSLTAICICIYGEHMAHISDLNNYWSLLVLGTGEWYHPWNLEAIWFALVHGTIQKYLKKSPSCCAYGSCNGQKVCVDYLTKSEKWTILTLSLWLWPYGLDALVWTCWSLVLWKYFSVGSESCRHFWWKIEQCKKQVFHEAGRAYPRTPDVTNTLHRSTVLVFEALQMKSSKHNPLLLLLKFLLFGWWCSF